MFSCNYHVVSHLIFLNLETSVKTVTGDFFFPGEKVIIMRFLTLYVVILVVLIMMCNYLVLRKYFNLLNETIPVIFMF